MINENELSNLLSINNDQAKNKNYTIIKNNKSLFGSPLKKFINNIYNKFEIPKESFIISLYYLYNFYNINKNNNNLINDLFKNINIYVFSCIMISLKQLYDEPFYIKNICDILMINYGNYLNTELIILKGINWNTSYLNEDFIIFKNLQVHYNYLYQHKD